MLPILIDYVFVGADGFEYLVKIKVYETENIIMFPKKISATFCLFRITLGGEKEIIYLIDNHAPFGFHEHNELPLKHSSRNSIHVKNWQEAWNQFQKKCREKIR